MPTDQSRVRSRGERLELAASRHDEDRKLSLDALAVASVYRVVAGLRHVTGGMGMRVFNAAWDSAIAEGYRDLRTPAALAQAASDTWLLHELETVITRTYLALGIGLSRSCCRT